MKDSFRNRDWVDALLEHLSPSKSRASASQPTAVEQPRDEPTAAVDANPPTPARHDAPAPPMADRSKVELDAFPDLWHDKFTNVGKFTAFLEQANSLLARWPTAEQFVFDLLGWAGRTPNKRKRYYQKVLDMTYILGLTDRVDYPSEAYRRLQSQALAQAEGAALRKYCARAAVARLKNGSCVLHAAFQLSPVTQIRLMKHLKMEEEEAHCYVRLFVNLGLLTEEGQAYCATTLAGEVVWEDIKFGRRKASTAKAAIVQKGVREKAPPSPASDSSMKKFKRCPALLPDRVGKTQTFMESIVHANNTLSREPTTDAFLKEMILWAGREYPKSKDYYQNILDSYYVVGLIDHTSYVRDSRKILISKMPSNDDIEVLEEICIGAALERLERGRQLLEIAKQLEAFTTKDVQAALNTHFHDASYHIRLFVNIGLFIKQGARYRLTPLAMSYSDSGPTMYEVKTPHQIISEPNQSIEYDTNQSSDDTEGLEVFAYLSIDLP